MKKGRQKENRKMKELPGVERPRERLMARGPENLKDEELLAILLRTGRQGKSVLGLARQILAKYSKKRLFKMGYQDLVKIKGISKAKAGAILAANELVKRALEIGEETLPKIKSLEDVVAQAAYMRNKTREHLMVIFLNARSEMICKKPMFIGTLNANLVSPREIFQEALKQNAASIILVHNHPSGNPDPSRADIEITKRIISAGRLMAIEVLDHVIIGKSRAFSFKAKKLI
jgi:DNA repair protein RadC